MPTVDASTLVPGVKETEDFLVFLVASSKPANPPYRVDLQEYSANGFCTCKDFQVRKKKALENESMPSTALECVHIQTAKRYLLFKILNETINRRENENRQKKKGRVDKGVSEATQEAHWPDDSEVPF